MRIHIASDLHLEIGHAPEFPGGDLLLLCGDTIVAREWDVGKNWENGKPFWRQLAKYDRVLVLAGNHESYHGVIDDTPALMRCILGEVAPNARLLDDEVEVIDGVAFVGSTLWAPCRTDNPMAEIAIRTGMNDFRKIATLSGTGDETRRLTTVDVRARHERHVAWLAAEIPKHKRVVVLTHHAPSLQSNTKYKASGMMGGDLITSAYCSDQEAIMRANPQISHWFHGHTHQQSDYLVGSTRVFSNQRGYVGHEAIARSFDPLRGAFDLTEGVAA